MKPGPLFRLLRLRRALCPSCHRDNIYRASGAMPPLCRWCGSLMIDLALITRMVAAISAFLSGPFLEVIRRAAASMLDFQKAMAGVNAVVESPPPANPLDSAIRLRRLPMDGADPTIPEVDASGYARRPPPEAP